MDVENGKGKKIQNIVRDNGDVEGVKIDKVVIGDISTSSEER